MEQILINLVAGALGGVATGKSSPTFDLGTIGNIISGVVGGGVLGQVVTLALPSIVAAAQSGVICHPGSARHVPKHTPPSGALVDSLSPSDAPPNALHPNPASAASAAQYAAPRR